MPSRAACATRPSPGELVLVVAEPAPRGAELVDRRRAERLPGRQDDPDRQALAIGAKVDLGREATARAAKTLVLSPPFAPAAQW